MQFNSSNSKDIWAMCFSEMPMMKVSGHKVDHVRSGVVTLDATVWFDNWCVRHAGGINVKTVSSVLKVSHFQHWLSQTLLLPLDSLCMTNNSSLSWLCMGCINSVSPSHWHGVVGGARMPDYDMGGPVCHGLVIFPGSQHSPSPSYHAQCLQFCTSSVQLFAWLCPGTMRRQLQTLAGVGLARGYV